MTTETTGTREFSGSRILLMGDCEAEHVAPVLLDRDEVNGAVIIQTGDFLPFHRAISCGSSCRIDSIANILEKRRATLLVIRGNHDAPSFFTDFRKGWGDEYGIRPLGDYESFCVNGKRCLAIGGAVSLNRAMKRAESRLHSGEEVSDPPALLPLVDWVFSHSAPKAATPPRSKRFVDAFAVADPDLPAAIAREAALLEGVLRGLPARPTLWAYGHFHRPWIKEAKGTAFICSGDGVIGSISEV